MRVAESWIKRGKPLDNVFIRMWADLFALHDEYSDSFWLPVDTDDKQERLDLISERLGVEFKTRWEVFGHHDKYQGEYSEGMTLDEVRQLFKPDWFDQFGYEL